jgi:hypothetical protein
MYACTVAVLDRSTLPRWKVDKMKELRVSPALITLAGARVHSMAASVAALAYLRSKAVHNKT